MFTVGVFAIILDDKQRILLCHRRDYDLWNLPGGGLEAGEAPWDGAVREVKEETGLEVVVKSLVGVYSKLGTRDIVLSFLCSVTGGELTTTGEADRLEYFEPERIPGNTSQKQVERIHDALQWNGTTIMKVQTGPSSIDLLRQGRLG